MQILAAQRLNSLRANSNVVDADAVCLELEKYIKTLFPKSFVNVSVEEKMRSLNLSIIFTLGNKRDYPDNKAYKDVAYNDLVVYSSEVPGDSKGLLKDATYRVDQGLSYILPAKHSHVSYDIVDVSRAFSANSLTAFIKRIKDDFKKLAQSLKSNISEVSEVMGKDMSSYIR